jgi:hypothetical protein
MPHTPHRLTDSLHLCRGPFKPILNSNKESVKLRKKVKSSSYGKKAAKKKVMTENIPTREEQELEGATFRPKLSKSKESIAMRKKVRNGRSLLCSLR